MRRPNYETDETRLSTEYKMLNEVNSSFGMYKGEAENLRVSIKEKQEQIDTLRREQAQDAEKLLRVQGALSALQHLSTLFRNWTATQEDVKRSEAKK